jgi:hypothetical protein
MTETMFLRLFAKPRVFEIEKGEAIHDQNLLRLPSRNEL